MNAANPATKPLRIACMISGSGRTVMNLQDCIEAGSLHASIELVIASRHDIAGIERARSRGLSTVVLARRDFASEDALHDEITRQLLAQQVELVCLCGYLRPVRIDEPLRGRIINIHPALLPQFGGKGMFGENVHRAVLASGATESGCTVHFVDEHYDNGPVILQRRVRVLPDDTPETLAARVFEQECIAYPQAIELIAQGRVQLSSSGIVLMGNSAGQ